MTSSTDLSRAIGPRMLVVLIVGDILGAGIYALVGRLAGHVGGMVWLPLLLGFGIAGLTAASYAELVGKYPKSAGAALYAHWAFGRPFFTFLIAFSVMMSGIASASAAALAFGDTYLAQFIDVPVLLAAAVFIGAITLVNFIGISQSITVNLVLTIVEGAGLLIVLVVGAMGLWKGNGDLSRTLVLSASNGPVLGVLGATALGFYALIGFEDSVNLAEECKEPARTFPRALFIGLSLTGIIYVLVSVIAVALLGPERLAASGGPLLEVVQAAGVAFPPKLFAGIALLAICNTALLNMMMASRLLYGMANAGIIPAVFARVHPRRRTPYVAIAFTVGIAAALIVCMTLLGADAVKDLATTTVVLLLAVFTVVNVSAMVLRRRPVDHEHFHTPAWAPPLGALGSALLASPLAGIPLHVYGTAAFLVALGAVLWGVNRLVTHGRVADLDAEKLVK
jgi:amino acid transporter